jgi:hypothetical protein
MQMRINYGSLLSYNSLYNFIILIRQSVNPTIDITIPIVIKL